VTAPGEPASHALTHRQIQVVFSGLLLGMLLAALDQTIVATALPTIVGDLGGLDHLSWVVTAYLLTSTASTPLYGKVSDLYGRKVVFQSAIVIFLIGSVLSGVAQNMGQLIAFRAVQGLGGGGLIAMALAIIGDIVSPRERGRYQGYTGAVFAVASVAGPLLGGFFVDHLSWRWAFYVNVPVGVLALIVTSSVLRLQFVRAKHRIDYLGSALLVATVSSVLLVTVWGGSEYGWSSPTIVSLVVAALVLLGLFLVVERRAVEPVLPLRLFGNSVFTVASGGSFIVGLTMFGVIIFIPLYLQVVNGASPTGSGLQLIPLMSAMVVGSVGSGRIISRSGRYKAFPVAGTAIMTFGLFLLSRLEGDTSRAVQALYMAVVGFGVGLVLQVLVLAVQNAVDQRDLGTATSATSFFRSMGGAFGVALFGTIFNDRLDAYLADLIPVGSKVDSSALRSSPEALRALPGAIRVEVIDAFARALHVAFLWGIPLAAIGFVAVLFLRELPLRESAHVGLEAVGEDLAVAFEPLLDPETVPDLVDPPPAPGPSAAT
jgi:EmrB/QacA subfamily drug resistance transporter